MKEVGNKLLVANTKQDNIKMGLRRHRPLRI
jgi:hypothetical protein